MARITGAKAHSARLRNLAGDDMKREIGRALYAGADIIRVEAAKSITAGSITGKRHVASLPGQAPNANTRFLDTHIITDQPDVLKARVISQAPYAAFLEYGTAKMAARPYMRPAVARRRGDVVELVRSAVQNVVSRGRLGVVT